jgi:hypothetical protein
MKGRASEKSGTLPGASTSSKGDLMRATQRRMTLAPQTLLFTAALFGLGCAPKSSSIDGTGGSTSGAGGSTSGTGGTSSTGGSPGSGGSNTGGSGSGTGGTGQSGDATFTINVTPSTTIATVEIVTWSVDVSIDSAVINFGRDQSNYEFQAPVDQSQAPSYRTVLLGMKQNTTYYLQIVAQGGGKTYTSQVVMMKPGYLANGVPAFTVTDMNASALYAGGGFTVGCTGLSGIPGQSGTSKTWLFVIDKDGALVWVLDASSTMASNCSRARMSYDGQYMFAGNFANASTSGAIYRIGMDGMGSGQTWMLPGRSHDFAILPNGNVVYFKMDNSMANTTKSPEEVMELDTSTGNSTLIYDEATDFGTLISSGMGMAHTNHIAYSPELKAITISMYFLNTVAAVSYPGGKLVGTFGGTKTDYSAMAWTGEHGHDLWPDHLWVFNNAGLNAASAHVLGFSYDTGSKTATQTLDYNPGLSDSTFGDVKELPNGNLFVTWSDNGQFHEITKSGTLLRKITTTTAIAYVEHRATLYGPPPPYDRGN